MLDGSWPLPHPHTMTLRFERYVALGDSSPKGFIDPNGQNLVAAPQPVR